MLNVAPADTVGHYVIHREPTPTITKSVTRGGKNEKKNSFAMMDDVACVAWQGSKLGGDDGWKEGESFVLRNFSAVQSGASSSPLIHFRR